MRLRLRNQPSWVTPMRLAGSRDARSLARGPTISGTVCTTDLDGSPSTVEPPSISRSRRMSCYRTFSIFRCHAAFILSVFTLIFAHASCSRLPFLRASDGSINIPQDLSEEENEELRQMIVSLLGTAYERNILPFSSPHYSRRRGVLDRLPIEHFMDEAVRHIGSTELEQ
jgi:hypothetical protein